MSTQVRDLYNKHHEVSEEIKSLKESIKDLTEGLVKAKSDNKGLQSEIILLVKQIAALEKIVGALHLAQKLKDQKATADKVVTGTPVGTTTAGGIYVPPGIVPSPTSIVKGHGDANTPPNTPPIAKTAGSTDSTQPPHTGHWTTKPKDKRNQPYWINDPSKGIVKNPNYINPTGKDDKNNSDNKTADQNGTTDQIPPI